MYLIPFSPVNNIKKQRINYQKKKYKINGNRILKKKEKYGNEKKINRIYKKNLLISKLN
mgnify:CR=1 FL=1